jgi:hypothetical protein
VSNGRRPTGIGVDSAGSPVIDPTANVIALVEAESKRLDEARMAESKRVDEQMALRADYDEKLRQAEAKRIDAIRAVDVNAVAVASQRAADQASVLANQVVQSAEALRTLVASTAATVAQSQQQLANTLSARLTTLEQAQYEGKGKQSFQDPTIAALAENVRKLVEVNATTSGARGASASTVAYVIAGISLLVTIAALFIKATGHAP